MRASYYLLVRQFNERLQGLAITDQLTGIANRRRLVDVMETEIRRAERMHTVFALVVFDLDHFKRVNDQNDHLFGSYVLSEVGKIVRGNIRKGNPQFVALGPVQSHCRLHDLHTETHCLLLLLTQPLTQHPHLLPKGFLTCSFAVIRGERRARG